MTTVNLFSGTTDQDKDPQNKLKAGEKVRRESIQIPHTVNLFSGTTYQDKDPQNKLQAGERDRRESTPISSGRSSQPRGWRHAEKTHRNGSPAQRLKAPARCGTCPIAIITQCVLVTTKSLQSGGAQLATKPPSDPTTIPHSTVESGPPAARS